MVTYMLLLIIFYNILESCYRILLILSTGTVTAQPKLTNNHLLDFITSKEKLTGDEKIFYEDQLGPRNSKLSQVVDEEYEAERKAAREGKEKEMLEEREREDFMDPEEFRETLTTPPPTKRPRRILPLNVEVDSSPFSPPDKPITPLPELTSPAVRSTRNVDVKYKDAIATVSYRTALSIEKSRVAVQAVCEKIYGHQYYLSLGDKKKFYPSLTTISEVEDEPSSSVKGPRSKKDYEIYSDILPSAKVASTYKHNKALHQEIVAAKTLLEMDKDTRCTLHFDTTSRSRVDGEWAAIILNFLSDDKDKCKMIRLRSLFFAYEDRAQITKLLVETFERLAVASNNEKVTAELLWRKIYAVMTDSVAKNQQIEETVAKALKSSHTPLHIFCKSHTCEKLDESCINALAKVEAKMGFANELIKRMPQIKSFVRQNKCIVVTAMKALLKLVSNEESAKPTSLSKEFDMQLEKDGVHKSFSLYKERRFTKLGYTAGAIVECLPQFREILKKTSHTNMLVRACKLYLESEYIVAAMRALANFTHKVTMPYLNFVEKSDQNGLVNKLKELWLDLKEGKMDTMKEFHVEWTHVNMKAMQPTSRLDHHLLEQMCQLAASGVQLQCSGEYWEEREKPRATQLHLLTSEERRNIPTENMEAERYLARFGHLASVSASRSNKFFKAKRIRDDMMFTSTAADIQNATETTSRRVIKKLNQMEVDWTAKQRAEWKSKIEAGAIKKARSLEYRDILLRKCKEHNGPFVTAKEVIFIDLILFCTCTCIHYFNFRFVYI